MAIKTGEELRNALVEGGIPAKVAEDIILCFDVSEVRRAVNTKDVWTLRMCKNVGEKRAEKIVEILDGKFAAPLSAPNYKIKVPDLDMHKIPKRTLVYENGVAKLSPYKYAHGELVKDAAGNPIKNIVMKRFGPAGQKLAQIEGTDENIQFATVSEIQPDYKDPFKEFELNAYWHQVSHYGIKMPSGETWVPGYMGTNDRMKSAWTFIKLKSKAALRLWMYCGAHWDKKKVNVAKIEAYLGLLVPYTKELLGGILSPKQEVLIPEFKNEHNGANWLISPDGEMRKQMKYTVNEFDGMAILSIGEDDIDKMPLTRAEKRRIKRMLMRFKGGTLRAPWQKGLLVVWEKFREFLKDQGVTEWNGRPVDKIFIWGDMSVFKVSIGDDCVYETFQDYCASFEELGHRFGILLENHGLKETFLPAQQLQAAHGCDPKYIQQGAEEEVEYLRKGATDPKEAAIRYEPNIIARIAQNDPTIMSTWFAMEMAANGYFKEYQAALGGRTHDNSITGFAVKDLIAFGQWVAYQAGVRKELPTGCLGKYQVFAPEAGYTGPAIASRNPVIANYGDAEVEVINDLGEYAKYFDEDFPYIMVSIHDDLCKLLRMDHDGDKIRLTFAKWFIDAVRSIDKTGEFAEWESFGEVQKDLFTDSAEKDFVESCTTSPALGLNVDACGKMIANGVFTKLEHEMLADYMMNKGTDVKQGADGKNVGGKAGVIWKEMKDAIKDKKMSKAMAYGKLVKGVTVKPEDVAKEIGKSNLEIVHKGVRENAPRALNYGLKYFDVRKVLYGNTKSVDGLTGGHFDKDSNKWVNHLFNEQVARNRNVWGEMDERMKSCGYQDYLDYQKAVAMQEYHQLCEETGCTMADIYDTIALYIFDTLRKKWDALKPTGDTEEELAISKEKIKKTKAWYIVLARTFLSWFGDTMEFVYTTNTEMGFLPAVNQPVEAEEDFFE